MPNVFKDSNLSFHYNKNLDNSINIPNIYILNRRLKKIGQIEDITELEIVTSFNEPNEISFVTHKYINNRKNSLWKYIKETALVSVEGFGIFEIEAPITDTDSTIKKIHGQDLCAVELGQSNCTLEINTEEDYTSTVTPVLADVKPTLFYNENDTAHSLLHRILSYAPHYTIDHVDDSLCGMNRELSCSDSAIYDFLTGDVSETFGCIFIFNKFKRSISAYDLKDHCMTCGSHHIIGTECQDCKTKGRPFNNIEQGYGYNSSVYVDTENLATEITLTSDKDSVKNCFKLVAGDDTMTEMIGQRLIGGTNYIWTFSNEMLNDMSDELREKYTAYTKLVESYQNEFNNLWNNFNEYTNQISYYKDNMFPEITSNITSATQALNVIQSTITYACIANKTTVLSTVSKSILNYAKLLLSHDYGVKFEKDTNGNDKTSCKTIKDGNYNIISSWTGNLYVYKYNHTDNKGNDLDYATSGAWTLPVKKGYNNTLDTNNHYSNDYYLYLKMQLESALAKSKISGIIKHDSDYKDSVNNHLSDADYYKNYFNSLNLTSLQSYYDAYNTASVIINQLNPNISSSKYTRSDGTISDVDILHSLLTKYNDFSTYINNIIANRQNVIADYETKLNATQQRITKINNDCDLKTFLGDELYLELLSFKREDTYKNDNFTSDMSDNDTDLLADIDEFILDAKEEIAKACQLQYSCTVSLGNLLLDKNFDYDKIYEKFALGNFIRLSIDDIPIKIRIIQMTFKFNDDIENLPITLSDALVGNSVIKDYQNVINNAKSMASSFQFITKQTDKNNKNLTSVVGKLRHEGLAAVNDMLNRAENISLTIDNQGLLGRKWNEDLNAYEDKQLRIVNNVIGFTDNNWETVKTALGNIYYNGSWRYGLIADVIVGNVIAGENLTISDKGNNIVIDGDGIILDGGSITWKTPIDESNVDGLKNDLNNITRSIKSNSDNIDSFKSEVNTQLSVAGVTKINNNYVYSPKISSGYLYIVKNGCSVQIDPLQNYDAQNDKVIDVQANNQDVFYIKRNGDGYFKGTIYAINGEFTGTISGSTISGSTISSSANGRSVDIANGRINLGGYVKIDSGLLNANSDQNNYSNALNFSCSGYPAEFGFRWQDTNVTMISNSSLTLGEQAYPIKDINMSGNIHIGNFHISSNLNDTWELDIYSNIDYPYLRLTQTNDALTIYPSKDSTVTLGKSDIRFANIYTMYVTTPSDRKLKKDIKKIDEELAEKFIDGLTPSSYSFKDNSYNKTHTGFIAQDVEKLLIDMGLKLTDFAGLVKTPKNIDNDPDNFEGADENYDYSLRYDDFIAPLVAYCQNLKKQNTELENKLNKIYEKLGLSD